jgi:putative endonuclease
MYNLFNESNPGSNTRSKGSHAETLAAEFLENKNHRILVKNFHARFGEIDLISLSSKGVLVFSEIKSCHSKMAGDPATWVHAHKMRTISRTASRWCSLNPQWLNKEIRFDVITIIYGNPTQINHYPNAFIPEISVYYNR